MRTRYLISFFALIISVFLILVFVLPYSINSNFFKTIVETELSDATGTDVQISGNMGFTFLPEQLILLEKVTIKNRDSIFASFDRALIQFNVLSLLMGRGGIDNIELTKPSVYIERYENGKLNIETVLNENAKGEAPKNRSFKADNITVISGSIIYSDLQKGHDIKLDGLNLLINDLAADSNSPKNISFTGSLEIEKLSTELLAVSDISMSIDAGKGLYTISPFKMSLLGGTGKGTLKINTNGEYPLIIVESDLTELKLKKLGETFNKENIMEGDVDLSLDVTIQAAETETIRNVNGTFILSGKSIVLTGYDIDSILQSYRKTQQIGVMDIGAIFVAGPLGIILTKGVEFGGLYRAASDKYGEVREFKSSWAIKDGVASTRDVAFATKKNRLALNGKLDFVNGTYEDLVASVVDTEGCSEFTQKIKGPLNDPQFEKPAISKSVFGAAISLYNKAKNHISGEKCIVFYAGDVNHPQ